MCIKTHTLTHTLTHTHTHTQTHTQTHTHTQSCNVCRSGTYANRLPSGDCLIKQTHMDDTIQINYSYTRYCIAPIRKFLSFYLSIIHFMIPNAHLRTHMCYNRGRRLLNVLPVGTSKNVCPPGSYANSLLNGECLIKQIHTDDIIWINYSYTKHRITHKKINALDEF